MLYPVNNISFRGYETTDAEWMKSLYTDKDYEVYFRDIPQFKTMKELEQFPALTNSTIFVIEKDKEPIGLFSLYDLRSLIRSIKFGVLIEKKVQRQKTAESIGKIIFPYLFDKIGLNKVECVTIDYDIRLVNIMKLWSFEVEGVLKDEAYLNGKFHDCILLGLTKKDYEEKVKCQDLQR